MPAVRQGWWASKKSCRRVFPAEDPPVQQQGKKGHFVPAAFVAVIATTLLPSCRGGEDHQPRETVTARRDINLVKEDHTKQLMSLPGVLGVYVGALDDGRACIGVMVRKKTKELEQKIPGVLEGYPVKIDETGDIKPMK